MKRKFKLKESLSIIKLGLRNPRFYIEAINLKWRYLIFISILGIAALALNTTILSLPLLDTITQDITSSAQYIPNYEIQDNGLTLAQDAKPVYYQSGSFQLVIDDTIESKGIQNYIPVDAAKAEKIADNKLLNLFILKDQTFVVVAGNMYRVPNFSEQVFNRDSLVGLLNSIQEQTLIMSLSVFATAFLFSIGIYWMQMLIIGLMVSFFNVRLTQPLPLSSRVKLSVMVSLVPLVILQIIDVLVPFFHSSSYLLIGVTLYIIYLTFRNHTQFIKSLLKRLNNEQERKDK